MADRSGKETSYDLIPHNMPELGRTKSCVSCVTVFLGPCLKQLFGAGWAREMCVVRVACRRVCLWKGPSNLEFCKYTALKPWALLWFSQTAKLHTPTITPPGY